jgi:hypothetical protein
MTTLLVQDLRTSPLEQDFLVKTRRRATLSGVRLYLYLHNSPMGSINVSIEQGNQSIITQSFNLSDIETQAQTINKYIHGMFLIPFDRNVILNYGLHKIRLEADTYIFSQLSYVGWVRRHEDMTNFIDYAPIDDTQKPLSFELWEFRRNV